VHSPRTGFRNGAFFNSVHVNGLKKELKVGAPLGNVQGHVDVFNASRGAIGFALHGIVDIGIGTIGSSFGFGNFLDPGC
jgi:hypothetical protein